MHWSRKLKSYRACSEAVSWAAAYDSFKDAWNACERGDWLLWISAKLVDDARPVVCAACECARLALLYVPVGEYRPRIAIETAERWARGEATTAQVQAAAVNANAYAAIYASSAASAAASVALYAATADTAADAVAAAYAAAATTAAAATNAPYTVNATDAATDAAADTIATAYAAEYAAAAANTTAAAAADAIATAVADAIANAAYAAANAAYANAAYAAIRSETLLECANIVRKYFRPTGEGFRLDII